MLRLKVKYLLFVERFEQKIEDFSCSHLREVSDSFLTCMLINLVIHACSVKRAH